jgi:hypothetical protein
VKLLKFFGLDNNFNHPKNFGYWGDNNIILMHYLIIFYLMLMFIIAIGTFGFKNVP